jgi:hypothetical protein
LQKKRHLVDFDTKLLVSYHGLVRQVSHIPNKKLLKNKDLNAASKLQIYKSIIRPIVTYGCETCVMTVTEQNRLLVFGRRVLRKIYGPTQDNDGA